MKKLSEQNINETKAINEFNPRITAYLESDLHNISPLFQVRGALENQAVANYVMTSLIKAYKEQSDTEPAFATNAVIKVVGAFKDSTKSDERIHVGIKECERLSLIEYNRVNGEVTLLDKCFKAAYVI